MNAIDAAMATIDDKAREVLAASSSAQSTPPALSRQNSTAAEGAGAAARADIKQRAPKWDGKCKSYARFKRQWDEIVHEKVESTYEHHLLITQALPKFITENISTLSETAEQIWNHLEQKFGNPKTVANEIMTEVAAMDHKKLGKSFLPKFAILINDAYINLERIGELECLTSKSALSELEGQLPNNEKAEWETMQHTISGENDFNKFRKFLKHRKDIMDAVAMMVTRKDMPKDPDKPDPNQNVCDYCGMTRHLEKDCRRKKNDDEARTPGASRGSRGSSRGRGNVLDQRGQRANLPKCVSCQLSNPSHVSHAW